MVRVGALALLAPLKEFPTGTHSPLGYPSPLPLWPSKTRNALYATTESARTATPSSSATAATSPCIKVRSLFATGSSMFNATYRLLWCAVHPRRSMALPQVHRLAGQASRACSLLALRREHCARQPHRAAVYVRQRVALSSRRRKAAGLICSAPSGCLRPASAIRSIWSPLTASKRYRRADGD